MMGVYAEQAGLTTRRLIPVPVLTPRLSSLWVGLVTPLPARLAKPLVESLTNEVIVTRPPPFDGLGREPVAFRDAVELALQRSAALQVDTRWSDAAVPGR
jgi:hypothetical protein